MFGLRLVNPTYLKLIILNVSDIFPSIGVILKILNELLQTLTSGNIKPFNADSTIKYNWNLFIKALRAAITGTRGHTARNRNFMPHQARHGIHFQVK